VRFVGWWFFQGLNGGRLTVAVDDPDDRL